MDEHSGLERADHGLIRSLRCSKCVKNIRCSPAELLNYLRTGWPKCCQETMTLFIEPKSPDGTKP
jgi:hypothetical protein